MSEENDALTQLAKKLKSMNTLELINIKNFLEKDDVKKWKFYLEAIDFELFIKNRAEYLKDKE